MSFWTDALGARIEYYDAGGWRTRALEAGDEGADVIMMGGLSGHVEGFIRNVVPLSQRGLRVHAIDVLGHGYTDKPLDVTYHAPAFTDHLLRFMDARGIAKAHIVGQSLGGWIALHTARTHPERVDKIVFATGAGVLLSDEGRKEESEKVHAAVQSVTKKAVDSPSYESVKARLEWLMADPATVTDELIRTRLAIYQLADSRLAMAKLVEEQAGEGNRRYLLGEDDLAALPQETLVIWTDKNPTTPLEVGRRASELIPNARFEVIENAGHWPMFEQPAEFNRLVGEFLAAS
ncbi:alpha/beta fold hydrolase [Herbiconiux ginsengi]|uniref:2-hydroxy-6-oxonona-2,4-dienedioate hydrolase/2-hydroxy-6-oxo-6-(2'-carboxyphenyl)-hexa-2,4-dienoate hydrolase n=1 Tax=Herbiconiux ginsengi TaxID=381665 RepID=A0A1H3MRD2_9MICO|nr:alpha/beta fold hydrolase [Herbiconiux ginsengi]SDY79054.1 2-hydroxy-6-oxonona-2,4-dienedioate hydrolase/2-hydroxy-6-oxo-6-(2'-carboxyphenyl)-hexa-2,4-dienoate hydrolase [Herbiconiux ginsengi]